MSAIIHFGKFVHDGLKGFFFYSTKIGPGMVCGKKRFFDRRLSGCVLIAEFDKFFSK